MKCLPGVVEFVVVVDKEGIVTSVHGESILIVDAV